MPLESLLLMLLIYQAKAAPAAARTATSEITTTLSARWLRFACLRLRRSSQRRPRGMRHGPSRQFATTQVGRMGLALCATDMCVRARLYGDPCTSGVL